MSTAENRENHIKLQESTGCYQTAHASVHFNICWTQLSRTAGLEETSEAQLSLLCVSREYPDDFSAGEIKMNLSKFLTHFASPSDRRKSKFTVSITSTWQIFELRQVSDCIYWEKISLKKKNLITVVATPAEKILKLTYFIVELRTKFCYTFMVHHP